MTTLKNIKKRTDEAKQRYEVVAKYREALEHEQAELADLKAKNKQAPTFERDKEIQYRENQLPGMRSRLKTLAEESKSDIKGLINQARVNIYLDESMKNDTDLVKLKSTIADIITDLKNKVQEYNNMVNEKADYYLDEVEKTGFNEFLELVNDSTYYSLDIQDPTRYFNATRVYNLEVPTQINNILK